MLKNQIQAEVRSFQPSTFSPSLTLKQTASARVRVSDSRGAQGVLHVLQGLLGLLRVRLVFPCPGVEAGVELHAALLVTREEAKPGDKRRDTRDVWTDQHVLTGLSVRTSH